MSTTPKSAASSRTVWLNLAVAVLTALAGASAALNGASLSPTVLVVVVMVSAFANVLLRLATHEPVDPAQLVVLVNAINRFFPKRGAR